MSLCVQFRNACSERSIIIKESSCTASAIALNVSGTILYVLMLFSIICSGHIVRGVPFPAQYTSLGCVELPSTMVAAFKRFLGASMKRKKLASRSALSPPMAAPLAWPPTAAPPPSPTAAEEPAPAAYPVVLVVSKPSVLISTCVRVRASERASGRESERASVQEVTFHLCSCTTERTPIFPSSPMWIHPPLVHRRHRHYHRRPPSLPRQGLILIH